jgi:chromosome partitioning protein
MSIIAITGRKGGIGKSTLTANLAAEFLAMGRKVIALDADPQQSLMSWSKLGEGILSGCVELIDFTNPQRFRAAVKTAEQNADRVLIDTPPGFTDPTLMASLIADLVLLPCGPSPLDILAAKEALAMTVDARAKRKDGKPSVRLVPSRVLIHTNLGKDLPATLADLGEKVLPGISQRIVVAEAAITGLTVREYAPSSAAQIEFEALAKAVERMLTKIAQI